MEQALVDVLQWLFTRSDPMLAACVLALCYWISKTNSKIDKHLDPKNEDPHPSCVMQQREFASLKGQVESWRAENREDHGKIFDLMRGGK